MVVSNIVQTVSLIAGEAVPLYRFVQFQTDGKIDLADDTFAAGTAQVDVITADGTPASAGTFELTINGHTELFAFDPTGAEMQTQLRAMLLGAGYGAAAVSCVSSVDVDLGDAGAKITLTFAESMGLVDIAIDQVLISAGNDHVLSQTTPGVARVLSGPIQGVSASASAAGLDAISISLPLGINKVEAGAAVSVGDQVTSDATGRAITFTSGAGGWIAGFALDAASGAGEIIRVYTQVMQDGAT